MNTEQERAELLPCPFCGGNAHIERMGTPRQSCQIACGECGAWLETGEEGKGCGKAWNRRAALQSQDREDAERYRVLRRALRPDGFTVLVNGYDLCTQKLDEAIDHARRVEGGGND